MQTNQPTTLNAADVPIQATSPSNSDQSPAEPHAPRPMEFLRGPNEQAAKPAKPFVHVPSGTTTITESARQLFTAIAPRNELFNRGDLVVRMSDEDGRKVVRPLDDTAAQSCFEKFVIFQKRVKISDSWYLSDTVITKAVASQYLKSDECRTLLPRLNGVVNCPVLMERDGSIHQVNSGYDAVTGLFVANQTAVPKVELAEAVRRLSSLLAEFDFKTPADRARALMSMLTPALKFGGFLKGSIPVEVAEANLSQSGKSYRQQLVAAIYHEKVAVATKRVGGVGSMEETFQSHLAEGRAFVQFDNVRGPFNSQFVESFLTANGPFPVRTPYSSNVNVDPSKHVLFISSNGFESTKDLANRSSIVRINKRMNHNYRLFNGTDLVTHVYDHYTDYLACVFAVVRRWFEAGRPRTADTRHDFKEWCQVGDWIVRNVFAADSLMDGHEEAKERASNPNLTFFRNLAVKLEAVGRLNEPLTATNIAEFCAQQNCELPSLSERSKDEPKERRIQVGRIMKAVLGEGDRREWEGYRVVRAVVPVLTQSNNPDQQTRYTVSKIECCVVG
jgi:hypothetical protein